QPKEAAQAPPVRSDSLAGEKLDAQDKAKQNVDKPYEEVAYRTVPVVGSRVAIWAVAQLHLLFAAFVLGVPFFAFIVEAIGYKTGDVRYDRLAHEFTKLLSVSFSLTATFGAFLTFMLIILYPKFTNYLMSVFSPTFLPYVILFFFEAFFLYTYYYGWGKFHPLVHLRLRLGGNTPHTPSPARRFSDLACSPRRSCRTSSCSSSRPSSSTPTTTAGGNFTRWYISAWDSASISWARRSCSSPMRG